MVEAASALAHQFDNPEQQREAATLGMWVFLATEVLFFGGILSAYVVYRYWYPDAFASGSRHLDVVLGGINTAVLLLSSFTMALSVHSAQANRRGLVVALLAATGALGCVFLGIKGVEYAHKFHEHLVPGPAFRFPGTDQGETATQGSVPPEQAPWERVALDPGRVSGSAVELFFSFYFATTGLHAMHLVIGVAAVGVVAIAAARGGFSERYYTPVEMVGLYWHFVDIVWVFLFPLLYLVSGVP